MSNVKAPARCYFFPFYSVLWKAEGASVIQKHPSTSRGRSRSRRLFLFYGVIILFPASDKYHSCDVKKRRKSEGSHIVSLTLEDTRPECLISSENAVCVHGCACLARCVQGKEKQTSFCISRKLRGRLNDARHAPPKLRRYLNTAGERVCTSSPTHRLLYPYRLRSPRVSTQWAIRWSQ